MMSSSGVLNSGGIGIMSEKTIGEIKSVTGYPTGSIAAGTKATLVVTVKNNRNIPWMAKVDVFDVVGESETNVTSSRALVGGMLGIIAQKEVEGSIEVDTTGFVAGTHKLKVVLRASAVGLRGLEQDHAESAEFTVTA